MMNPNGADTAISPEQRDTARLLERLLGSTFAERYLDFCRLASGSTGLRVSRPLAAHALREFDSVFRGSLAVPFDLNAVAGVSSSERLQDTHSALLALGYDEAAIVRANKELNPPLKHQAQIRAIAARLGLEPKGDIANTWVKLTSDGGKAHERSFHRTLRVDEDFRERIQRPFDKVIRAVILALQDRYAALMRRVEELAGAQDVLRAAALYEQEIPGALPLQWRFFELLEDPVWLIHLRDRKLLGPAQDPATEGAAGELWLRSWPAGNFLLRMARSGDIKTQQRVAAVITQYGPTLHPEVMRIGFEILAALAPSVSGALAGLAAQWLDTDIHPLLVGTPEQYLKNLAQAGSRDAALTFARSLFKLSDRGGRIGTHYSLYLFEHALLQLVPSMAECCGLDALQLFCELLNQGVLIEKHYDPEGGTDFSDMASGSICDDDDAKHDPYSALIFAVRKSAEVIALQPGGRAAVAAMLLQFGPNIFKRILLHILAQDPAQAPEASSRLLSDPYGIESTDARFEYAALARAWFPSLTPESQQRILAHVDAIPDRYRAGWKQRFTQQWGAAPTTAQERTYDALMKRDLYWHWREVLPADRQADLLTTVAEHGDPEAWRHPPWGDTHVSPMDLAHLSALSVEEVVRSVNAWEPSGKQPRSSRTALAHTLRNAVERAPEKFGTEALRATELRPLYLRAWLQGLTDAARNRRAIPWRSVLPLIRWVAEHLPVQIEASTVQDGDDNSWLPAAYAAAELLTCGLQRGAEGIEYDVADDVYAIIMMMLAGRPYEPEGAEFDEKTARDVYIAAQRTLRGSALQLCLLFVFWSHVHSQSSFAGKPQQAFAILEPLSAALARELAAPTGTGWIPRAILGRYLSWIQYFGGPWLKAHFAELFPQNDAIGLDAAWSAHLLHDPHPVLDFLPELEECYLTEINALTEPSDRPRADYRRDRLAQRLLGLYLSGRDPERVMRLLDRFWVVAEPSLRSHVLWTLVQDLRRPAEQFPDTVRERALAYWDLRLSRAEDSSDKEVFREELGSIGQWFQFPEIDPSWLLDQLLRMLRAGFSPNRTFSVTERLSSLCVDHVDRVVEALEALLRSDHTNKQTFFTDTGAIRSILVQGMAHGTPRTVQRVEELVSFLASHGVSAYLDISRPRN